MHHSVIKLAQIPLHGATKLLGVRCIFEIASKCLQRFLGQFIPALLYVWHLSFEKSPMFLRPAIYSLQIQLSRL